MIVDKINTYLSTEGKTVNQAILDDVGSLAKYAFFRQFGVREAKTPEIWLSSVGHCVRQQAYNLLGFTPNGKEIDSRAKMVFFQGDMTELAIIQLARQAGCDISDCGMTQAKAELDGARGRVDGILHDNGNSLVEVKSMASYAFERFEGGDVEQFLHQTNAYMHALGLGRAVIVGLNKDSGVLHEHVLNKDLSVVDDIKKRIATIRAATKENLPSRPFGPDEKGMLPWNCLYCAHSKTCWPNSGKVLVKGRYKLKESV